MKRRPTTFAFAGACACALGVAACGPSFDMGQINSMIANARAVQRQQGDLGGQLAMGGAGEPAWTFAPNACKSGQLEGFYGVDLASSAQNGAVLRLVRDPIDGPRLRRKPSANDVGIGA